MATILCVDDDVAIGAILGDTLERIGHRAEIVRSVPEALLVLARGGVDAIISDYRMPAISGIEFLSILASEDHDIPLIMLTGHASIEHAVASIKAGAFDYITKPVSPEQIEIAVAKALQFSRLRLENGALRREVARFRNEREVIGESEAIRRIMAMVTTTAPTRATVLLQGESGTGKELIARAIHEQSDRRDGPFVTLNCAALPEGLVESALFGHEKGAFTGAVRRVEGAFERAHRGTLLLDEISEMRVDLQAKLLRVLQEQEFERVGGTQTIRTDVRVVATTNRDLAREVDAGNFRKDLFYRLSVMPILVPPLRERAEDIPLLALTFAKRIADGLGKEVQGVAPEALDLLLGHGWPGNIRELQHAVERAVILARGPVLQAALFDGIGGHLALRDGVNGAEQGVAAGSGAESLSVVLRTLNVDEAERELIRRALEVSGNNRTRAAEMLGLSVRTLRNKLNGPGAILKT